MEDKNFILRKAIKSDLDEFFELDQLCFDKDIAFPKYVFAYYLKRSNVLSYVIEVENKIVAFIIASYKQSRAHIITIDVHPDYQRRGYGEKLMKLTEEELIKVNVKFIFLYVAENNYSAIKLYQKLGYKIHDRILNYYKKNLNAYVMIKNIV